MPSSLVVGEKVAKSILNKSGIKGVDYVINPYSGCSHNCVYCYASFMKRFTGHSEPWGTFVDAKVNAPELLASQLRRPRAGRLFVSSVTDCYQPLEAKYEITRRCLEVLVRHPDIEVSILTKSVLVLRDVETIRSLPNCSVGFTITSTMDAVSRLLEPGASSATARLQALRTLRDRGISTWAFFGPILPFFGDGDDSIGQVFRALEEAGVRSVMVDPTNFYPTTRARLQALYRRHSPEACRYLEDTLYDLDMYTEELRFRVWRAAAQFNGQVDILF